MITNTHFVIDLPSKTGRKTSNQESQECMFYSITDCLKDSKEDRYYKILR